MINYNGVQLKQYTYNAKRIYVGDNETLFAHVYCANIQNCSYTCELYYVKLILLQSITTVKLLYGIKQIRKYHFTFDIPLIDLEWMKSGLT